MQDPTAFQSIQPHFPEQEQLNCPRCDSPNTKFCYYNNYNLSQPRHFCKNCRRYWTKGGSLRNIPVGGGSRKNTKRSSTKSKTSASPSPSVFSASSAAQASASEPDPTRNYPNPVNIGGGFSSLLAPNEHLGNLLRGQNSTGSNLKMVQVEEIGENASSDPPVNPGSGRNPGLEMQSNRDAESFLSMQNGDSSCWNGSNGWSSLAIYTPGSGFQ